MSKEKLIPELRFPEFEKHGEWDERNLGEIGDFIGGGTPSTSNPDYWDGDILWYTPTEVKNGVFNPSIRTITQEGLQNSSAKLLPTGTILITTRATIGDAAITNKECATNQGFQSLVVKESEHNQFWYYWIIHHKHELERRSSGSTFKEIGKTEIQIIPTLSPKKKEQQKIASCLSSLDELIAAHNDKLDALKDHKKGLLQNLFPQEGETVPKVRFPEFEDDGEWVERKLGEVFNTFSGGTPKSTEKKYYGGSTPFIRSAEIAKNSTELFLTDEGLKNSSAKLVKKGDLLIALYGANSGDVAISKIDGAINQAILCLRSDFSNEFVSHYFFLKKDWITRRYLQGGQGNLSGQIVKSIELYFPKQEEQQKIASCLSAVDELITAQQEKIEQLQQHKKGLMQGLFPNPSATSN